MPRLATNRVTARLGIGYITSQLVQSVLYVSASEICSHIEKPESRITAIYELCKYADLNQLSLDRNGNVSIFVVVNISVADSTAWIRENLRKM